MNELGNILDLMGSKGKADALCIGLGGVIESEMEWFRPMTSLVMDIADLQCMWPRCQTVRCVGSTRNLDTGCSTEIIE